MEEILQMSLYKQWMSRTSSYWNSRQNKHLNMVYKLLQYTQLICRVNWDFVSIPFANFSSGGSLYVSSRILDFTWYLIISKCRQNGRRVEMSNCGSSSLITRSAFWRLEIIIRLIRSNHFRCWPNTLSQCAKILCLRWFCLKRWSSVYTTPPELSAQVLTIQDVM